MKLNNCICKRCDYNWTSQSKRPISCPRCKSYSWSEIRKQIIDRRIAEVQNARN